MMVDEIKRLADEGITEAELVRAKQQLVSSFLLAQESTPGRASAIGRAELIRGSHLTEEEIIQRIDSVTMSDITDILPTVCDLEDVSVAAVGRCGAQQRKMEEIFGI